jgi:hypothetical protein
MKSQKLIMEGWRRFLNESRAPVTTIDGKPIHMYYHSSGAPGFWIILYIVDEFRPGVPRTIVVGGVDVSEIKEPCIPKTLQVEMIYRNSDYSGAGLGPLLYDLAFFIAQSMGYGLTSDREVGSKKAARERWSKIEKDSDFQKQKTTAGNDTFDYDESTPDPDDDCIKDDEMDTNATDHSFIKKDVDHIHDVLMELEGNHMDRLDNLGRFMAKEGDAARKAYLGYLRKMATTLFQEEYDLAED